MNKTILIFKHEFLIKVKGVSYKIMTLLMPALLLITIIVLQIISGIVDSGDNYSKSIGYVDEVGSFDKNPGYGDISLIEFKTEADAKKALLSENIAEYFIISQNYFSSGIINRYTLKKELMTPPGVVKCIKDFLTINILKEKVPDETVFLINTPLLLNVTRLDKTGVRDAEQGGFGYLVIPALFALLLALSLNISSTSLVQGLGYEKENRVVEVLLSSVSARQLFLGKLLSLGIAGLIQVFIWLVSIQGILAVAGKILPDSFLVSFINSIQLPVNFFLLGAIYFILGYLLYTIISLWVGAVSPNSRDSVKYAMIYSLFGPFIPVWFASLLINLPDNIICTILTIFPFTASVTTMIRLGVSGVPVWQLLTGMGVLVVSVVGLLFFAIRAFRMSLLNYGKNDRKI